jgi:hypothetical protein
LNITHFFVFFDFFIGLSIEGFFLPLFLINGFLLLLNRNLSLSLLLRVCVETRGFQAHLIILEEAAYIDEEIYKNVILPLKSNAYLGTVAITTPANDLNWFSYFDGIRDEDGKKVYKTFFEGTACKACRDEGVPENCDHKEMPHWKSTQGIKQIKSILQNDKDIYNREIQGVITADQV